MNSQVLTLSEGILACQLRSQKKVVQDDYLRVQGMIDAGPGVLHDYGRMVFVQAEGEGSMLILTTQGRGASAGLSLLRRLSKGAAKEHAQVQALLSKRV